MFVRFIVFSLFIILPFLGVGEDFGNSYTVAFQSDELAVPAISSDETAPNDAPYTIETVPNPKLNGQGYFVSNPSGILRSTTIAEIDLIAQRLEENNGAEYAVVVIDDYVGESDFEFALALFNSWGIGKQSADNGLLLLIVKNRQEYRFISGYGMERLLPDAYLKRVGEQYLVPHFKGGDYDKGVLEATKFIAQILSSADAQKELAQLMPEAVSFWSFKSVELRNIGMLFIFFGILYLYVHLVVKKMVKDQGKQPKLYTPIFQGCGCMGILLFFTTFIFAFVYNNVEQLYQLHNLPFFCGVLFSIILAMKINNGRHVIKGNFKDAEQRDNAYKKYLKWSFLPLSITPLAWIDVFLISKALFGNKGRFSPPDLAGSWVRVVRDHKSKDVGVLSQGQHNEERLASRRYEIWKNSQNGKLVMVPWEINNRYKRCPKCSFYTLELSVIKIRRAATYSATGEGEEFDKCHNCSYRLDKGKFTIPKKERSSSRSSGGSSRSSGGSSRSSGGSSRSSGGSSRSSGGSSRSSRGSSRSGGGHSSGGGSFGGGSSGGGGAGGRW